MATGYLTSSSLIATIKRIGMIPTSQSTFFDDDFLAMANQEIRMGIIPSILQYHEEYYVRDSANVSLVSNQSNYPIPYRAIGGKFRAIYYKDQNSNLRAMSRISPDDRPFYQQVAVTSDFVFFYIAGNDVVLLPPVGVSPVGSLVFSYFFRPNELVSETRVATVQSISVGASTTVYTVDQVPSNVTAFIQDGVSITGFSSTSKLDILQSRPGHKTIFFDVLPSAVDANNKTITFDNDDVDTSIIAGDYIAFAGECIIPQIPADLHDVLAQRVVLRCLSALGDQNGVQIAAMKLKEMEQFTPNLVDNRSEGNPQKINNNRSILKASRRQFGRWPY